MDPVTLGAVVLAVVTGASEALGGQLLERLSSLVKRPSRRQAAAGGQPVSSGEPELAVLRQDPGDQRTAVALAEVLLARASDDSEFGQALHQWWAQAEPVRASLGEVTNTVSGGIQYGPVLQGRDFTNLTFGASSPPPAPSEGLGSS